MTLSNGLQIDRRCYDALQEMMDACREAGYEPLICSAYRTQETQQDLFNNKVAKLEAEGKSHDEAVQEAGTVVAVPGTSEHQLGLTVDVVDVNNQNLTEEQEKTPTQKWLMANSWRYGFIHRYPNSKSDITGIIYEPWHYRYVGKDAAQEIFNKGITLEEYLGVTQLRKNKSRGFCRGSYSALLAVLGVLRILGVLVDVLGILLAGVLLVFGVFALLHVGHLLFVGCRRSGRYSVSMTGSAGNIRGKLKKLWLTRDGKCGKIP